MKKQLLIALTGIILGNFIAILFGVNEGLFKNKILKDLRANPKITSIADEGERLKKIESEESKNWRYYQRFHFHSTGVGAISLGALLILGFIQMKNRSKSVIGYMIAIGGLLYPFVWLFAAIYGPEMGRSEAKEAFAFFGYMGGVYLVGLCALFISLLKNPFTLNAK